MPKIIDLINKQFGKLTAIKPVGVNKQRHCLWLCVCKCGEKTIVPSNSLRSGNTKSCGCLRIKHNNDTITIINLPQEIWKDIQGYEGRYQVSDMGRIKSLIRWNSSRRILRPATKKDGHLHVSLSKNKNATTYLVHSLVILTFVGLCPDGQECRHLDGDPQNNKLSNLRYGTHKENMQDCSKHGKFPDRHGINNGRAKLTPKQVIDIRELYDHNALLNNKNKLSQLQIANMFEVSEYTIWAIINKKTWKHI